LEASWNAGRHDVKVDLAEPNLGRNIPPKTVIKFTRRSSIRQCSLMDYNETERIRWIAPVEPVSVSLSVRVSTTELSLPAVIWSAPSWREELMEEDVLKFEV